MFREHASSRGEVEEEVEEGGAEGNGMKKRGR